MELKTITFEHITYEPTKVFVDGVQQYQIVNGCSGEYGEWQKVLEKYPSRERVVSLGYHNWNHAQVERVCIEKINNIV